MDIEGIANTENTIEILSSKYNFENTNEEGTYTVSYVIKHTDNSSNEIRNLTIKVYDETISKNEKAETNITKNKISLFRKIINVLKYFFINLFKSIAFIFTFGKIKPCW